MGIIEISQLDIIFGKKIKRAFSLLDDGATRNQLAKSMGLIVGVKDINLSINKGEFFVLMGLSGSGKSTLLRAINGLTPIARGQIEINIHRSSESKQFFLNNADRETIREIRTNHVSMVFQNFALLPWKTVEQNVAFGLELAGADRDKIETNTKETIKMVGLDSWTKRYPDELSGGMKQRVGLARALATDADILLMDEPFSALDPLIRSHLQTELLSLQRSLNKTILFVTHDLDEALKLGSRIAIMQDGQLIQVGQAEEIIKYPRNQYVKDFVAQIDQTKLLRAKTIMTSINKLKVNSKSVVSLDSDGTYRCFVDHKGRPRRSLCGDNEGKVVPWSLFRSGVFGEHDMVLGSEHLSIKDVIEALGRTKRPMVIQDKQGRMVGAITTDSIFDALSVR